MTFSSSTAMFFCWMDFYLESCPVVHSEHALHEMAERVIAQVAAHVSHPTITENGGEGEEQTFMRRNGGNYSRTTLITASFVHFFTIAVKPSSSWIPYGRPSRLSSIATLRQRRSASAAALLGMNAPNIFPSTLVTHQVTPATRLLLVIAEA